MEKALKSEDRSRTMPFVNPVKVLESLGIDSFSIDWENKIVYTIQPYFRKLANHFGKPIAQQAVGFVAYGWLWRVTTHDYGFESGNR